MTKRIRPTENTPTLETDRLLLRKFTAGDLAALFAIYSDTEVNTYLPWFPLKTMEEAKTFYEKNYKDVYNQPVGYKYAICLKSNCIPIGYVNVSIDRSHDLGYGLLRDFWHKGIMTEACRAVITQLKKDGIAYITATHDIHNPRSGSVMRQLGMEYQYSYEEQWQPKNKLVTFRMYQLNLDEQYKGVYTEYWDKSTVRFKESIDSYGQDIPRPDYNIK